MTLVRSTIGCTRKQKACVSGLGLRKVSHSKDLQNTPSIRGMIRKVSHLVRVEAVRSGAALSDLALKHAVPIYIADHSKKPSDPRAGSITGKGLINGGNATGTLVEMGERRFCVTNKHVLDSYRERKIEEPNVTFQIGSFQPNLDTDVVSVSSVYDLAVIDLSTVPLERIVIPSDVSVSFGQIDRSVVTNISAGNFILFGGFPGVLRDVSGSRSVRFNTLASGGSEVHDAREHEIVCLLELDKCHIEAADGIPLDPTDLAGLSGAPIVAESPGNGGDARFSIAGFIFEIYDSSGAVYARPATLISDDGIIEGESTKSTTNITDNVVG